MTRKETPVRGGHFRGPGIPGPSPGTAAVRCQKELCETLNLKSIIFGGRIPGYGKYAHELTPAQYIQKVKATEIYDPVLTFNCPMIFTSRKS